MDDDENAARDNDLGWRTDVLKFWFACPTRRCRRARSCVGDPAGCHAILLPVVSEEVKGVVAHAAGFGTAPATARPAAPPVKPWRSRASAPR